MYCSAPALIAEVARDLPFAPAAQALADGVMSGMAQSGALVFNSLHLRIEADAKDWTDIIGGSKVCGAMVSGLSVCRSCIGMLCSSGCSYCSSRISPVNDLAPGRRE